MNAFDNSLTSVGGTENIPETAVSFSSGGFSNYFTRPIYQEGAITEYLNEYLGNQNAGLYNPNGRGFPDVAAYAVAFDIIYDGFYAGVSGTSCASPTFASVVALLNDELVAAGRPVLGFLNPWLYLVAAPALALNDITEGNNYACSDGTTGFNATVGWDPVSGLASGVCVVREADGAGQVTGLGSPNYAKLRAAAGLA